MAMTSVFSSPVQLQVCVYSVDRWPLGGREGGLGKGQLLCLHHTACVRNCSLYCLC